MQTRAESGSGAAPRPQGVPETIGRTPLLRLRRLEPDGAQAELWAKAEWFNPGGSVKDRAGLAIVRAAQIGRAHV